MSPPAGRTHRQARGGPTSRTALPERHTDDMAIAMATDPLGFAGYRLGGHDGRALEHERHE